MHSFYYKSLSTVFLSFFITSECAAQRYRPERTYDIIGLAGKEEITDCLVKGLPFLFAGLIIFFICTNKKNRSAKENKEDKGSWLGCFSLILIGVGFIIMLPLWAWIEAIGVTLVGIVSVLAIICLIYKALTKK